MFPNQSILEFAQIQPAFAPASLITAHTGTVVDMTGYRR